MGRIKQWFCGWLGHDWTTAAMKGKPPTKEQVEGGVTGFNDYATMYCEDCGYVSKHTIADDPPGDSY